MVHTADVAVGPGGEVDEEEDKAQTSRQTSDSDAEVLNLALRQNLDLQTQLEELRKHQRETYETLQVLREAVLGGLTLQEEIRRAVDNSRFTFYRKHRGNNYSFETEWKFEKYGLPYKLVLANETLEQFARN